MQMVCTVTCDSFSDPCAGWFPFSCSSRVCRSMRCTFHRHSRPGGGQVVLVPAALCAPGSLTVCAFLQLEGPAHLRLHPEPCRGPCRSLSLLPLLPHMSSTCCQARHKSQDLQTSCSAQTQCQPNKHRWVSMEMLLLSMLGHV